MWKEFREFAMRGNVIDLAIGIMIGGAFGRIVTSLVNDVLMPPIGLLSGGIRFDNLFIALDGSSYATLEEAQAAGAPTLNIGLFINAVIDFLIIAFAIFLVVRQINRLRKRTMKNEAAAESAPAVKTCPECLSEIPAEAKRCRYCTTALHDASAHA
ncbi:MAG: mechanosensitive ion channel protein MscL [Paenibacillaceae bacterium ZCTH02-B3]|nr:MAG: mechanosensitive ion channel protein MscL [Paenibacillaceae bacterium ZCTH02-B3]